MRNKTNKKLFVIARSEATKQSQVFVTGIGSLPYGRPTETPLRSPAMTKFSKNFNSRGSVLILVLWALSLLAVFAIQISAMTQDKIVFLAKSEHKNVLRNAAKSGIFKALAMIRNEPFRNKTRNLLQRSLSLYYNPAGFRDLSFGQAETSVFYQSLTDASKIYGVTDELSRLNLNIADRDSIRKLLIALAVVTEDQANTLADGIFDWRESGESQLKGFESDDFYESLEFPYPQKKGKYETLDELKLVEGMTQKVYQTLIDYVTIYTGEETNINTVTWPVLEALGFSEEQAKTVVAIRRGADGREGTLDDFLFVDRNMMVGQVIQALAMKPEEVEKFTAMADRIPFVTDTNIFRIQSHAELVAREENTSISCVFNAVDDKIIYWREH